MVVLNQGVKLGTKQVTVSDRTGKMLDEKDKVNVVVRSHPDLTDGKAKVIDVHRFELSHLKAFSDTVHLELNMPDGSKISLSCSAEEFEEFFTTEQLSGADYNRGRRTGFSPNLKAVND